MTPNQAMLMFCALAKKVFYMKRFIMAAASGASLAVSLLGVLLFGALPNLAFAQANPAASQCEKCIQSGLSIYKTSRDEQAAYCSKIGMCPADIAAVPKGEVGPAVLPNIQDNVAPAVVQAPEVVVPPPAAQAAAANGAAPNGSYQCWFFNTARGGLNFTLASGSYTDVQGKPGTVSGSGADMAFSGGALDGVRAHFRGGNPPTVSILGPRGDEVSACQLKR